jgi:hypothetical protein
MAKTLSKPVDAEEIAEMAEREQDVSAHFTNQFTVVRPEVPRVKGDLTEPVLDGVEETGP